MTTHSDALAAKLAASRASMSATNIKKVEALVATLKNEKLCKMLDASAIDAARFTRAIYASEKVIKFAANAVASHVDFAKVNENAFAAFKTAMLFAAQDTLTLHKRDIEASISRAVKVADDRRAVVYTRNAILSDDTLAAQSQQCVDMLKTLNIISETSARAQTFNVTRNALADALCEAFKIETQSDEVESETQDA